MRSISARAPAQALKPAKRALMFIGKAERRLLKPECISPQIERQWARCPRSEGNNRAQGLISWRYSAIANVSQIFRPLWVRHAKRKDGESKSNSARVEGSSAETCCSSKSSLDILQSNQPRNDH